MMDREMTEYLNNREAVLARIRVNCREANLSDYRAWLYGFLRKGGRPTHFYDYNWPREEWYVAQRNFTILPTYGADSMSIIVPRRVNIDGDPGHTDLFFEEDYRPSGIVPIFRDIEIPFFACPRCGESIPDSLK